MLFFVYNKEQHVFLINFKYMTILLKRGVLVALKQFTETESPDPDLWESQKSLLGKENFGYKEAVL